MEYWEIAELIAPKTKSDITEEVVKEEPENKEGVKKLNPVENIYNEMHKNQE